MLQLGIRAQVYDYLGVDGYGFRPLHSLLIHVLCYVIVCYILRELYIW